MDKDKLDRYNRLVIGKMKSYRLSDDYKEFVNKVDNKCTIYPPIWYNGSME